MSDAKYASSRWIKGILRAEMAKKGLTYADLSKLLRAMLIEEDEKNLANKIGRGNLTAILFMQCLSAMGLRILNFEPWPEYIFETSQEKLELQKAHQNLLMKKPISKRPVVKKSKSSKSKSGG